MKNFFLGFLEDMDHTPYRRFIYRVAKYARGLDPQEKIPGDLLYLPGVSVRSKTFRNDDTPCSKLQGIQAKANKPLAEHEIWKQYVAGVY